MSCEKDQAWYEEAPRGDDALAPPKKRLKLPIVTLEGDVQVLEEVFENKTDELAKDEVDRKKAEMLAKKARESQPIRKPKELDRLKTRRRIAALCSKLMADPNHKKSLEELLELSEQITQRGSDELQKDLDGSLTVVLSHADGRLAELARARRANLEARVHTSIKKAALGSLPDAKKVKKALQKDEHGFLSVRLAKTATRIAISRNYRCSPCLLWPFVSLKLVHGIANINPLEGGGSKIKPGRFNTMEKKKTSKKQRRQLRKEREFKKELEDESWKVTSIRKQGLHSTLVSDLFLLFARILRQGDMCSQLMAMSLRGFEAYSPVIGLPFLCDLSKVLKNLLVKDCIQWQHLEAPVGNATGPIPVHARKAAPLALPEDVLPLEAGLRACICIGDYEFRSSQIDKSSSIPLEMGAPRAYLRLVGLPAVRAGLTELYCRAVLACFKQKATGSDIAACSDFITHLGTLSAHAPTPKDVLFILGTIEDLVRRYPATRALMGTMAGEERLPGAGQGAWGLISATMHGGVAEGAIRAVSSGKW